MAYGCPFKAAATVTAISRGSTLSSYNSQSLPGRERPRANHRRFLLTTLAPLLAELRKAKLTPPVLGDRSWRMPLAQP